MDKTTYEALQRVLNYVASTPTSVPKLILEDIQRLWGWVDEVGKDYQDVE